MSSMRRLMNIMEAYLGQVPYVPGSGADPSVKWKRGPDSSLIRKPGDSIHWEVVGDGPDWMFRSTSNPEEMLTQREWMAATGSRMPRFADAHKGGNLSFPEKQDAEDALQHYEIAMHRAGYR